eukprot:TRINITY_DN43911_c0_g1_i1.p1 TRINITY_DN43911_c0_g1~~TRINITY_DN43911_c0_g1_i1.p1  ORF type:complete len:129 (-),score=2.25 TRINITY_DN43911_c0_g1_i1:37-423(-)
MTMFFCGLNTAPRSFFGPIGSDPCSLQFLLSEKWVITSIHRVMPDRAELGIDRNVRGFVVLCQQRRNAGNPSVMILSLIHISEPTRLLSISYAVFCLKKKHHKAQSSYQYYVVLIMIKSNRIRTRLPC